MKIACLLDSLFEDNEFQKPYDAFRQAGHEVTLIGTEAGKDLAGFHGKVKTRAERGIDDVRPEQFDALFIPGGISPDRLRANPEVVKFAQAMVQAGKPTFAICHGPQVLITADVVRGRRMTAWSTIQGDLHKAGAQVEDRDVVVDHNLVTSRKPDDIPAFVREALAMLAQPHAEPARPTAGGARSRPS